MSWRDHVLEWLCALAVAVATLLALHQIERRAAASKAVAPSPPPPTDQVRDLPVLGG